MPLARLDHITVLCSDLARSRAFYSQVLGIHDGDRPDFNFPGAWLYLEGRAVVHLVGGNNDGSKKATGSIDHIAFEAQDLAGTRQRFTDTGIPFTERGVPGRPLRQIFLHDPDGVKIELNFRGEAP
jgi:catechol 2,3-dioxygenase-like lactoylglutathione lyase family enzyme